MSSASPRTGERNIITIAWCGTICSDPPMVSVSIRPSRRSHGLITESREFVINIPPRKYLKETDLCGNRSGKDTDKFKLCSFTPERAAHVSAPMIKECPVSIECKVKDVLRLGAHDMFIGEILAVHVDNRVIGENGDIDYSKAAPFVYNQGEYWGLDKKIGFYGFSSQD